MGLSTNKKKRQIFRGVLVILPEGRKYYKREITNHAPSVKAQGLLNHN
jgi:hypothetical protein